MPEVIAFFQKYMVDAIGIGTFGPIDINKSSSTYGHIFEYTKLAWQHYPLLQVVKEALPVPIVLLQNAERCSTG